jgi:ferredoxin/flavodoxin---NADP+ reductase
VILDAAIIGGGPAGLAAAMYCGLRGLRPVVFEAQAFGGQLVNLYPSKPVNNFPAQHEILSGDLAHVLAEQAARFGAELREREPVDFVGGTGGRFTVRTTGGEFLARTLVLALGRGRFAPRKLGIEDEDRYAGRGVVYQLPHAAEIQARRVVVVGGGDTAVDTALALRRVASEVTLVHRGTDLRAYRHSVDRLTVSDVRVVTNAEVVQIGGDGVLEWVRVAVENEDLLDLRADLLLISIGQVPNLHGLETWDLPLDMRGSHLPVSSAMRTAIDGVLAAGDFVDYPGKVTAINAAVAEGATAAASIERHLRGGQPDQRSAWPGGGGAQ